MKRKANLYLEEHIIKTVKKIAIDNDTSMSAITEKLLEDYIKKESR